MEIIYTTLVGSKMHGLSTPSSDEDIRHITLSPLREIISPFKDTDVVRTHGEDEETWELRYFVKHLVSGNPTVYEVIKSPLYSKDMKWAETIRSMMPLSLDSKKILYAHIGYAEAQLKRYLRDAVVIWDKFGVDKDVPLSSLWEENKLRRIPKSVVAAYRVLAQGEQLLTTGDFQPVVSDYSQSLHDQLMEIKTMDPSTIDYNFCNTHLYEIEARITAFKNKNLDNLKFTPDIEKIKDILCEIYGDGFQQK